MMMMMMMMMMMGGVSPALLTSECQGVSASCLHSDRGHCSTRYSVDTHIRPELMLTPTSVISAVTRATLPLTSF